MLGAHWWGKSAHVSPPLVQPHTLRVPPPPQVWGEVHGVPKPQSATVRVVPQLSVPVTRSQFLPSRLQNAGSVSGTQTEHTLGLPPPPQTWGEVHGVPKPQSRTVRGLPQTSFAVTVPQFLPSRVQNAVSLSVEALQPQTPEVQVWGEGQVPQLDTVRATPHLSVPLSEPQLAPSRVQNAVSLSTHPHLLVTPPPPQVLGELQVPQLVTVRALPQLSVPLAAPQSMPSRVQNVASVSQHTLPEPGYVYPLAHPQVLLTHVRLVSQQPLVPHPFAP
jgi:hypothetical protein